MNADLLANTINLLDMIEAQTSESDIDGAIQKLAQSNGTKIPKQDFKRLEGAISRIHRALRYSLLLEQGLSLFTDTTRELSNTLELQGVFQTIVKKARNLVGAHVTWVTVLDEDSHLFRTVEAEGHLTPAIAEMTASNEYGLVSLIKTSNGFIDTQDYLNDQRFEHMPDLDKIFQSENIVSLAGFPILSDGDVQGFLFVADRYERKLSGREISLLGSFALHAGVAMRNAKAFRLMADALDDAQHSREKLLDHISRVEASAIAHDEMTALLASGGALKKFIQGMANQIGGAVFLSDSALTISSEFMSPTYIGQMATDIRSGAFNTTLLLKATSVSRRTGRAALMHTASGEQCHVIALHGETSPDECLVICHSGELDAIDIRNLERSAVALSIAKLWNDKRETEKLIASSTLLRHLVLVAPPDLKTVSAVHERLALGPNEPIQIALIVFSNMDELAQTELIRQAANRRNILVDMIDEAYVAIGTTDELHSYLKRLSGLKLKNVVGGLISEPLTDLSQTASQYTLLKQAFRIVAAMKTPDRFIQKSEINFFAKIFETEDSARLERYTKDALAPFNASSPRHAIELKKTLLSFLENQYNVQRTAAHLGIHINTVRQRLDSLRELTGGWDDPVKALDLHIALKLESLLVVER